MNSVGEGSKVADNDPLKVWADRTEKYTTIKDGVATPSSNKPGFFKKSTVKDVFTWVQQQLDKPHDPETLKKALAKCQVMLREADTQTSNWKIIGLMRARNSFAPIQENISQKLSKDIVTELVKTMKAGNFKQGESPAWWTGSKSLAKTEYTIGEKKVELLEDGKRASSGTVTFTLQSGTSVTIDLKRTEAQKIYNAAKGKTDEKDEIRENTNIVKDGIRKVIKEHPESIKKFEDRTEVPLSDGRTFVLKKDKNGELEGSIKDDPSTKLEDIVHFSYSLLHPSKEHILESATQAVRRLSVKDREKFIKTGEMLHRTDDERMWRIMITKGTGKDGSPGYELMQVIKDQNGKITQTGEAFGGKVAFFAGQVKAMNDELGYTGPYSKPPQA
jgi:hypothetical protein